MCAQKSTFETDFPKSNNYPGLQDLARLGAVSRVCDMPFSSHEKGLTYISCFWLERYFPFDPNVPILDVNRLAELTDRPHLLII